MIALLPEALFQRKLGTIYVPCVRNHIDLNGEELRADNSIYVGAGTELRAESPASRKEVLALGDGLCPYGEDIDFEVDNRG